MHGGQRPYALDFDIRTFDEHYSSGVIELVSAGSMINLSKARSFGAAHLHRGSLVSIKNANAAGGACCGSVARRT